MSPRACVSLRDVIFARASYRAPVFLLGGDALSLDPQVSARVPAVWVALPAPRSRRCSRASWHRADDV